jgi:hypothetical protein
MARFFIADEVNDSRTVDVLAGGALETASTYTNYFVNSGTASGVVYSGKCYLHTINIAGSADPGQLLIGDATEASAVSNATSAGLVAKFDLSKRGSHLFDVLISNTLTYRLTGLNCDGITITYRIA